ncbi:MAG: 1-acyl-sn-glycerol-3-phosphate acyltransferase [Actinomycetota bacterium]|nr:1-acyl-sn-glycerol-3-phosphate acyltransferase [Actinomycetota bacterium]
MDALYRSVVRVALATLKIMRWDVTVTGAEHIPAAGPALLASNHIGYLDFVFLGVASHERDRLVRFMAMEEAFHHWLAGPLLRGMHHIPVDRYGHGAPALGEATRALEAGEVVGIHPESRMSPALMPMAGKTGAARMALSTGAPLIPAAVWGSQRILPRHRRPKFPRHVAISVKVGPPIPVDESTEPDELTDELMARIGTLLGEAIGDYPQAPTGTGRAWWWPAHLGGGAPTVDEADARWGREKDRRARERRSSAAG